MFEYKQKYTDYNDVEREETLHFHLNKAELRKMESSEHGGLSATISKIFETRDEGRLLELFYKIIDMSYGIKDADGRSFRKSPKILEDFKCSEAYSEFAESLLHDENLAGRFIAGIMPKDMREKIAEFDVSKLSKEQQEALEVVGLTKIG